MLFFLGEQSCQWWTVLNIPTQSLVSAVQQRRRLKWNQQSQRNQLQSQQKNNNQHLLLLCMWDCNPPFNCQSHNFVIPLTLSAFCIKFKKNSNCDTEPGIELFPLAHRATVRGCASTKLENSTLENPSFFSANENCIGVIYKSPTQPTETK